MLIVLHSVPITTPAEAKRSENLLAVVVFVDLVREVLASVHVVRSRFRLDTGPSDARVLQRVDVDGHAKSVSRENLGSGYGAVVEARGVVGLHGGFIIRIEVVH